jgi:hypothetical protein
MTDKERESSTERHAYGFMTLEPMIRDLERYAILLGDHIDEDAGEMGTKCRRCVPSCVEYYRLWD